MRSWLGFPFLGRRAEEPPCFQVVSEGPEAAVGGRWLAVGLRRRTQLQLSHPE